MILKFKMAPRHPAKLRVTEAGGGLPPNEAPQWSNVGGHRGPPGLVEASACWKRLAAARRALLT